MVVGMPVNLDGEDTNNTPQVKGFVKGLKKAFPDMPIHLHDERFTSSMAMSRVSSPLAARIHCSGAATAETAGADNCSRRVRNASAGTVGALSLNVAFSLATVLARRSPLTGLSR